MKGIKKTNSVPGIPEDISRDDQTVLGMETIDDIIAKHVERNTVSWIILSK